MKEDGARESYSEGCMDEVPIIGSLLHRTENVRVCD